MNKVCVLSRIQFWLDLFSDLRERHLFNGSPAHTKLLRYCFLGVLQKELDEYKLYWNTHTIRPVHQSRSPSGKPEAMYHIPQRWELITDHSYILWSQPHIPLFFHSIWFPSLHGDLPSSTLPCKGYMWTDPNNHFILMYQTVLKSWMWCT